MGFYKYLGTFEADYLKHQLMKSLLTKEYKHRVRKYLCTYLYSRNLISVINSCANSLLQYSGGIGNWTQAEMRKIYSDTRKLLTMYSGFRSALPLKEEGCLWTDLSQICKRA